MARAVTGRRLLRQSKNKAHNERDVTRMGGADCTPRLKNDNVSGGAIGGTSEAITLSTFWKKEWESARVLML